MSPKLTKVDLTKMTVSNQELDNAKKIIEQADKKALLSKKASLKHYLLANPQEDGCFKGPGSQKWLEHFIVHSLRCKEAAKEAIVERNVTKDDNKFVDTHWWSMAKMNTELGEFKAQCWRESGILPTQIDPIVSQKNPELATDPRLIEYAVPINWQRLSIGDLQLLNVKSAAEAEADDIDAFLGQTAGPSGSAANIKVEEPTDTEKLAMRIQNFKASFLQEKTKYDTLSTDAKMMRVKAESAGTKYHKELIADLATHVGKNKKIAGIIERMMVEECNDAEIPKVFFSMDQTLKQDTTLKKLCAQLGFYEEPTAPRGGKRARKSK